MESKQFNSAGKGVASLLSTAYFGPVQWFQKLFRSSVCYMERYDSFIKQTYRNRCVILTSNGPQALSIPVEGPERKGDKILVRDVRISDHGGWRHVHWNAIASAYGESPFFEFYADDLRPFFEKRWTYLYDFNMELTQTLCRLIDFEPVIKPTESYVPECRDVLPTEPHEMEGYGLVTDYRSAIRPKHPLDDPSFQPKPYYQLFARETGFKPNLSILDLLFNEGNEAILYL